MSVQVRPRAPIFFFRSTKNLKNNFSYESPNLSEVFLFVSMALTNANDTYMTIILRKKSIEVMCLRKDLFWACN